MVMRINKVEMIGPTGRLRYKRRILKTAKRRKDPVSLVAEKQKSQKDPVVIFSTNLVDGRGNPKPARVVKYDPTDFQLSEADSCESDISEGAKNRAGEVPVSFYEGSDHVGYDIRGKKVEKTLNSSEISRFLEGEGDENAWRKIVDEKNQSFKFLSDADLEIVDRIKNSFYPLPSAEKSSLDFQVEFENKDAAIYPEYGFNPPKSRFLPSKSEVRRMVVLARLMKEKKIKTGPSVEPVWIYGGSLHDLWGENITSVSGDTHEPKEYRPQSFPAPKVPFPEDSESYNFSEEHLLNNQELNESTMLNATRKYTALRKVPLYQKNVIERFERCLDLYLCPRSIKMKLNIDPESLLPVLPSTKDFEPFPKKICLTFDSPNDLTPVTSLSLDSTGSYLAAGRTSGFLEIYDVRTTRIMVRYRPKPPSCLQGSCNMSQPFETVETDQENANKFDNCGQKEKGPQLTRNMVVSFSPSQPLIAVGYKEFMQILYIELPMFKCKVEDQTSLDGKNLNGFSDTKCDLKAAIKTLQLENNSEDDCWSKVDASTDSYSIKGWCVSHKGPIKDIKWHCGGKFLLSVAIETSSPSQQLGIHSLVKLKTTRPFKSSASGLVDAARFHPSKSWLLIGYHKNLRIYDLKARKSSNSKKTSNLLVKKFYGFNNLTDFSVHPLGDFILMGCKDGQVFLFDYETGSMPYKNYKYHEGSVTNIMFHRRYPLFFSSSADGSIHVFHSLMLDDLSISPTIIPLKKIVPGEQLKFKSPFIPVNTAVWHPTQPWIVAGLESGNIVMIA